MMDSLKIRQLTMILADPKGKVSRIFKKAPFMSL